MTTRYLLAADVGGTKTDIAYGHIAAGKLSIVERKVCMNENYASFDALVDDFGAAVSAKGGALAGCSACLAVAGPVEGTSVALTNLPWRISAPGLAGRYGLHAARIINDFEAVGYGLAHLGPDELLELQRGERDPQGVRVAAGAGTGLGVAILTRMQERYAVHATEAGHADFAPNDALQDDLLIWLRRELGHVSYERVVSGSGLTRIYRFLVETGHGMPSTGLEQAVATDDAASAISEFGLQGRDPLAARALDVFARVYGGFAGNMALITLARGGVYIAGGIAPKIADKLKDGRFMEAFLDKGRFKGLLATIPVNVVMNPGVGLYGAFEVASRSAEQ